MRAIVITKPGGPEVLEIREVADPVPGEGEVLIEVKAFGVNHAETHMRKGEWSEATPISGIEAVGTVVNDLSGALAEGTKVIAIMGGLGQTRNGSYARYTVAPICLIRQKRLVRYCTRAFTELAGVDLVANPARSVYQEEYAHGGMSSGMICLDTWRQQPMLIGRAERLARG
jgi:NADPH:quinone reductase-like Zn-dependent oxidoreductase